MVLCLCFSLVILQWFSVSIQQFFFCSHPKLRWLNLTFFSFPHFHLKKKNCASVVFYCSEIQTNLLLKMDVKRKNHVFASACLSTAAEIFKWRAWVCKAFINLMKRMCVCLCAFVLTHTAVTLHRVYASGIWSDKYSAKLWRKSRRQSIIIPNA